jgi:hypothetical protein
MAWGAWSSVKMKRIFGRLSAASAMAERLSSIARAGRQGFGRRNLIMGMSLSFGL